MGAYSTLIVEMILVMDDYEGRGNERVPPIVLERFNELVPIEELWRC